MNARLARGHAVLAGFRRALASFLLAFAFFAPPAALAVDLWTATPGVPSGSIPIDQFKYMDADQACRTLQPLPPDIACNVNARNMRNYHGPQVQDTCVYDVTCTCQECGTSQFPNGGNTISYHGMNTWKAPQSCDKTASLDKCSDDTPRAWAFASRA